MVSNIPNVKQISSLAFNQANKSLYFVTNEQHRESQIFVYDIISTRNLFHGMGIKHIAYDWVAGNIYYAVNGFKFTYFKLFFYFFLGVGIGVCSSNGRYCHILIKGMRHAKRELPQTYGGLIVHPKRGNLIWLDYNVEHPNGVIMVSGMDGHSVF